jgi:hypothetical protein
MAMAIPTQYTYVFEERAQSEKPANNASHISAATRNDPAFKWHHSGKERRGLPIWQRAKQRKVTAEYKAFLATEKARREAALNELAGLMGQMSMATAAASTGNNYALSLTTGEPSFVRQQRLIAAAEQTRLQAAQLKAEINEITRLMGDTGMGGGKKRRHTKRHRHSKRRHTRRN